MGIVILKNGILHAANQYIKKTAIIQKDNQLIVLDHPHQHIALLHKLESIHAKKISAIKSNKITEKLLETIATVLPNTLTLQSLYLNSHNIKILGVSDQLSSIQTYRSALQQYLLWKKISIAEIHNDPQNKLQMDFTLRIIP